MSTMTFTKPRATLEELLEFANRVRQAGGGNPLDALMPAVPVDSKQCLIAKNLNFNCEVRGLPCVDFDGVPTEPYCGAWAMHFQDRELRDRIAEALELPVANSYSMGEECSWGYRRRYRAYAMILPNEIGQVASDFDRWNDALRYDARDKYGRNTYKIDPHISHSKINRLREFLPYIQASVRETYANGVLNEKGELIL